jgi:hypothetical protein
MKGGSMGVPNTSNPAQFERFGEVVPIFEERNFLIVGVTKDSSGAALGNCLVRLFNAATNVMEQSATSDASGNYTFTVDKTQQWYAVSYKVGAPDVAGTTRNDLVGA